MVSRKTVSRMSRYRRLLQSLRETGVESIYSHQLARHAVVSAAQVRRDLMVIGYSGSPNKGYDVTACIDSISHFLDGSRAPGGRAGRRRQPRARRALPLRRQEPLGGDRGGVRRRPRAHRHAHPRGALPRRLPHGGAGARPRPADRRAHGARGGRAGGGRDARARRREEHHQLRAHAARPPQRHLRRVHGHHGGARVRRLLRPPRRARRAARPTATATSSRWSGNWNPCSRGRT